MPSPRQRGATLALVLVLLVALSMLGVAGMRGAIDSERIAQATRAQQMALQAAELALHYCEAALLHARTTAAPASASGADQAPGEATAGMRWPDLAGWDHQALGAQTVPLALLQAEGSPAAYRRAPECLVESTKAPAGQPEIHTVTARGFGPDVPASPLTGAPAGAETWVQSQLAWPADGKGEPVRSWRQLLLR